MPSSPLNRTATLVVAGVVGLVVLAAFALALRSAQQDGRHTVEDRFADGSKAAAALVATIVSQAYTSDADLGRRLLSERTVTTAALRRAAGPSAGSAMVLLDHDGQRLAAYPAAAAAAPTTGAHVTAALAGRPALSGQIGSGRRALVEVAVPYDTPYGRRVLLMPTPMAGVQRVLGPYLQNLPGLAGHRAYLVDQQAHLLARSGPGAAADPALTATLGEIGRRANRSYAGGRRQLSSAPVAGAPWDVVDTTATSVLYSPVNGWQRALPWIALLVLLPAGAFILWLAHGARRAAEKARQASEAKSAFLASMSHELRTPMTTVMGFSEMLHAGKLGPVSDRQAEALGHIATSSRHLNQLLSEILDLSRVEEGRMAFDPQEVEPHVLVGEVVAGMRGLADDRQISLVTEAPDVGVARLDPARFKQVLYNLIGNAIKFTQAGGRVTVRLRRADGGALALDVIDNGPGLRPDELQRVFLPFEQGAHRNGGAGLGLAVSRRIADAQDGSIQVVSTPGRGATFTFTLPAS